jgi:endonuclease/exonuclease/phosphatase family metal-dependent hydrolase
MMKLKALFLSTMILSMNLFSLEQQSENLRILVYNTHGLPEIFISDNPKKRFPVIGKKTQDFNISLLQEDYSHHEELSSGLAKESLAIRGGLGGRLICPFCTGSGLTSVFNLPKNWTVDVENQTYDTCSGWLRGANDCFAYKGFQIIKITLPNNKRFFIVNTHMDAGKRDSDRTARKKQLEHIISTIKQRATTEALIVAGDLNLNSKNPEDVKLLENFKEELKLTDSFTGHKISKKWTILDYILYKQGEELEFKIISVGEDESFVTEEGPLSDHPALIIEVSI